MRKARLEIQAYAQQKDGSCKTLGKLRVSLVMQSSTTDQVEASMAKSNGGDVVYDAAAVQADGNLYIPQDPFIEFSPGWIAGRLVHFSCGGVRSSKAPCC